MVGIVGRILGEAAVNIAGMQVSRDDKGGAALVALSVDSAIPADTLDEIEAAIDGRLGARGQPVLTAPQGHGSVPSGSIPAGYGGHVDNDDGSTDGRIRARTGARMPTVGWTLTGCLRAHGLGLTRLDAAWRQGTHVRPHPRRRPRPRSSLRPPASWPADCSQLDPRTADPGEAAPRGGQASADRPTGPATSPSTRSRSRRSATPRRQAALQRKLEGKSPFPKGAARAKQVPLELEGTDRVFVVLAEFGDQRYPADRDERLVGPPTDAPAVPAPTQAAAPTTARCTTRSPSPTARMDNSTLWQADYNRAHYEDMYFNRMKEYYEHQSSGRYSIDGDVTEWVKVPFNQARYGRDFCGSPIVCLTTCASTKALLRDAHGHLGRGPARRGHDDGRDPGLPEDVRHRGPLRHRRRRQLRRAGRLHRPLPDRPRGRRRGGRRPDLRHRRHLEPPLVRQPPGRRPRRPARRQDRLQRRRVRLGRRRPTRCPTTRPASGSATTPSSRRTVASASSPTSTATTSACRTSTTPPATPVAPRTTPASGP